MDDISIQLIEAAQRASISCYERQGQTVQEHENVYAAGNDAKTGDLVREAVGCNR